MDLWRIPRLMVPMMYGPITGANGIFESILPYYRHSDHSALKDIKEVQQVVNDDKKFGVALDVSQFHPNELNVHVEGRELTIECKQEHKTENGFIHKAFVRKWHLPYNVNLDAVKTQLNDKGHLTIEVPKIGSEQ